MLSRGRLSLSLRRSWRKINPPYGTYGWKGALIGLDTDKRRFALLDENAKRLGIDRNKEYCRRSLIAFSFGITGSFDMVLNDAQAQGSVQ
jgi:16S rRNA C967 or C1407 C5-methylase (RsmB/RsmF family)